MILFPLPRDDSRLPGGAGDPGAGTCAQNTPGYAATFVDVADGDGVQELRLTALTGRDDIRGHSQVMFANGAGSFRIVGLQPGTYRFRLEAVHPGVRPITVELPPEGNRDFVLEFEALE